MPLPNLIHPVDCVIEPINRAATVYNRGTREPIRNVARKATVTVEAQVSRGAPPPEVLPQGLNQSVDGYLLVRKIDIDEIGYYPAAGDRIVKLGWEDVETFVVSVGWAGHYPDQMGASLLRIFFADRALEKDLG